MVECVVCDLLYYFWVVVVDEVGVFFNDVGEVCIEFVFMIVLCVVCGLVFGVEFFGV